MRRVLLITDGKPGHEVKSHGIARALGKLEKVETIEVCAQLRFKLLFKFFTYYLRIFSGRIYSPNLLLRLIYKKSMGEVGGFDYVISSGASTIPANILLSTAEGVKNFYAGTLRGIDPFSFTLVVSGSSWEHVSSENVINIERAPVDVDLQLIRNAAALFSENHNLSQEYGYWAVLIGGVTADYEFTNEEVVTALKRILSAARKEGIKVLISTSRRTDPGLERLIKSLLEINRDIVGYAVYWHIKPERVVTSYLGLVDCVFVTEDSNSMLNEAILARKLVVSVFPQKITSTEKHSSFIERALEMRRLYRLPAISDEEIDINDIATQVEPMNYGLIDYLADEMSKRLTDIS
jgi:mitochondrial fission protein ELM1